MHITDIKDPSFLKEMTIDEMNELAKDIRVFLVNSISKTGGHLASNLGVVELTIALHKVFDSPNDKIFFDVGHQSYVHKILTGRADRFTTLRQYNGIAGFQKRNESIHDPWEAGHSSTSLSAALGMAVARDLEGKDYHIVPVIGDGAMSSGESLEALNHIGYEQRNVIIIFNDNNMSISRNVGGLTQSFSRLRTAKGYNALKTDLKSTLKKSNVGKYVLESLTFMKDTIKETIIDKGIFGEFQLEYLGPVDGHNISDLISALETARDHEGPVVVHVITRKGKGYGPCEKDSLGKWHGVSPFDVKTGKPLATTPQGFMTYSEIISSTLCDLADHNEDIIAITPAMVAGSKLSNFFTRFPKRSFDCGICEEHAATFAAGLAVSGKRPFLSIYSSFLQRAYDQINHVICRMDLPGVIGIDRAGLVGDDGPTHHGVFDIGLLRALPNMIICQGKDGKETQNLLHTGFTQDHPYAIRYPRGTAAYEAIKDYETITIGTWTKEYVPAEPVAFVLTYGDDVVKVNDKFATNELPYGLINCRFFKPLDEDMLDELAASGKPLVIYEHDMLAGGLGSAILEYYNDHNLKVDIIRMGIQDQYVPQGAVNLLRKDCHMDINSLLETLEALREEK